MNGTACNAPVIDGTPSAWRWPVDGAVQYFEFGRIQIEAVVTERCFLTISRERMCALLRPLSSSPESPRAGRDRSGINPNGLQRDA